MDADKLLRRGIYHYNQGNIEEAIVDFNQVISFNPHYAKAYYYRSLLHSMQGNRQSAIEEAIDDLNKVISLNPRYAEAYHYRGLLHIMQENKQGAIEDLQQAAILLSDKEYTALWQELHKLIKQYSPSSVSSYREENNELKDDWIYHDDNWYESYDDLAETFPKQFLPSWEIDFSIADAEAYKEEELRNLSRLEQWLSKRIECVKFLRQKRAENAKFDRLRLQSNSLPLCNCHEAIALAMGISVTKLRFLAFSRKTSHYIRFQIPKKTGGKRDISAPMPHLKQAQEWILHNILEKLELHNAAHGFRRGRSIVTNAQPHIGTEAIINIDFKDFFPSISYKRVKGLFKSFGFSEAASFIFGLICTEPKVKEVELDGKTYFVALRERHLPQGAPTSPAISNLSSAGSATDSDG